MNVGGNVKAVTMVVDDEQIVQESVSRILEEIGFRVDVASRVDQALDLMKNTKYDLILTDLMMPDRNGMELVETVAREHPDTGVIMFTGYPSVDSAVGSIKLGAIDYLPKPFNPEQLVDVTERALKKVVALRREKEAQKVYEAAEKALGSSLDLKKILDLICYSSRDILKVKGTSLLIRQKDGPFLELAASYGLSDNYVTKGALDATRSIAEVQLSGKGFFVDEASFEEKLQYPEAARQEGIVSILSFPLSLHGAVIGCLRIYSSDNRKFEQKEMDLITKFSKQSALAIENAILYETMKKDIEGLKKYMA
ncbi:MAG: response regulator [Deltaproteobacteria bacterium]|nr:response regulator [Deltaproteobacteria bacterium]